MKKIPKLTYFRNRNNGHMKKGVSNKINVFFGKDKTTDPNTQKHDNSTKPNPIFDHKWKDATATEIKEESIEAYKKFAF